MPAKTSIKNRAIDIISTLNDADCRGVLIQILKIRPSTIIQGYQNYIEASSQFKVENSIVFSVKETILRASKRMHKIACIKLVRLLSDIGLKEAKEAVETVVSSNIYGTEGLRVPYIEEYQVKTTSNWYGDRKDYNIVQDMMAVFLTGSIDDVYSVFLKGYKFENNERSKALFHQFLKELYVIE